MKEYYRSRPNLKNRKKKYILTKKFSSQRQARVIKKPLIMIDPGHGGVDSGAISRSGVWEKHIVVEETTDSDGNYTEVIVKWNAPYEDSNIAKGGHAYVVATGL